jgi:hypothetical protein
MGRVLMTSGGLLQLMQPWCHQQLQPLAQLCHFCPGDIVEPLARQGLALYRSRFIATATLKTPITLTVLIPTSSSKRTSLMPTLNGMTSRLFRVRNYNFKEGQTHTQIGLIAQEVELVSPGLVSESPDRDEDGNDLGTVTKSVNYSVLYMKAVKALQEAMERIETLEGMVAVNNITIDEQQHQLSTLAARLTALESA